MKEIECDMNNLKNQIESLDARFSAAEFQLSQMETNYPFAPQNMISAAKTKCAKVKVELVDTKASVGEAFTDSQRSGDHDYFTAKFKIIYDYAHSLVMDFNAEVERVKINSLQAA